MRYQVTDENFDKFNDEIIQAAEMLQVATLCLRSLYIVNSPSVASFVKLREKITNDAMAFSENVLPPSNELIRNIRNFFYLYDSVNLDKFKSYLDYFIKEADDGAKICEITLKLYKRILEEFRNRENEVLEVLDQLNLKTKEYEKKKKELLMSADVKLNWAIGLALLPGVNAIASPILYVKGNKDIKTAIAKSEEGLLTVAAAETIKGPLITSLIRLIDTFEYISEFYITLINELNELKTTNDNLKEVHYKKMKNKSSIIKMACSTYLSKIPDVEANLEAIPDDYDRNYVQEWLSRR